MASEFDLIRRHFQAHGPQRPDVPLGIGDDCALLAVPAGHQLAVSLDLLVSGVHFFADAAPEALGHKALAVNLSDLAAAGAEPAWVTLGLTLPEADEGWLEGFCRGFFALAARFGVQLVGGDTTRGPLTLAVQAHGFVPAGAALLRSGARPGDLVCVTGTPGEAGAGLALKLGRLALADATAAARLIDRLERPSPRVAQGLDLRGLASSCIDVSDGLAQDLGHILAASGVGATLELGRLPCSPALAACGEAAAWRFALGGGDDYELLFTLPPARLEALRTRAAGWDCGVTVIGAIEAEAGLRLLRPDASSYFLERGGYDHFG